MTSQGRSNSDEVAGLLRVTFLGGGGSDRGTGESSASSRIERPQRNLLLNFASMLRYSGLLIALSSGAKRIQKGALDANTATRPAWATPCRCV